MRNHAIRLPESPPALLGLIVLWLPSGVVNGSAPHAVTLDDMGRVTLSRDATLVARRAADRLRAGRPYLRRAHTGRSAARRHLRRLVRFEPALVEGWPRALFSVRSRRQIPTVEIAFGFVWRGLSGHLVRSGHRFAQTLPGRIAAAAFSQRRYRTEAGRSPGKRLATLGDHSPGIQGGRRRGLSHRAIRPSTCMSTI